MKYERLQEIKQILLHEKNIKTIDICQRFNISIETARRDLDTLAKEGYIRKVYGGAELNTIRDPDDIMANWSHRSIVSDAEKRRIAACAVDLIPDDSTIVLDSGTTTHRLAGLLGQRKGLTVLTNSLHCAMAVTRCSDHTVYLLGGMLKQNELITTGYLASNFLDSFNRIDLAIIGVDGFHAEEGVSDYSFEMCMIKQRFLKKSDRILALADHTKFSQRATYCSCPLHDIDVLITDEQTDSALLQEIKQKGIEIIIAN